MMRRMVIGCSLLGLGVFLVAVSHGQSPLSGEDAAQLIAHDAKNIQDLFAKKLDPKRTRKIKAAALMIAAYAQDAGMADVRDQALKILNTVDKDGAGAKKLAAALKPGKAGPPLKAMALEKELDLDVLMKMFAKERFGGFDLETALEDLVEGKDPLKGDAKDKALVLANKLATIAVLTHGYAPEKDEVPKTKVAWIGFSKNTQIAARDLVAAIKKDGDVPKMADKLSMTCTKCHDVFKQ